MPGSSPALRSKLGHYLTADAPESGAWVWSTQGTRSTVAMPTTSQAGTNRRASSIWFKPFRGKDAVAPLPGSSRGATALLVKYPVYQRSFSPN